MFLKAVAFLEVLAVVFADEFFLTLAFLETLV